MIKHEALKAFDWYPNGYTLERLELGDARDFGDVANGLLESGYIGAIKALDSPQRAPTVALKPQLAPVLPQAAKTAPVAAPAASWKRR